MRIVVTQEHIKKGKPSKLCECPIALAIQEQTGFKEARVSGGSWRPSESYCARYLTLPLEAGKFVRAFDNHLPVEPFSFELDLEAARVD